MTSGVIYIIPNHMLGCDFVQPHIPKGCRFDFNRAHPLLAVDFAFPAGGKGFDQPVGKFAKSDSLAGFLGPWVFASLHQLSSL